MQYTRYATVVLCLVQRGCCPFLFQHPESLSDNVAGHQRDDPAARNSPRGKSDLSFNIITAISLTAGTLFLMWLGDQITERGIGTASR